MGRDSEQVIDQRLVRAVAHPLRVRILELLIDQDELSPNLIAQRLGAKLGSVSYHVKVLRQCDAIELTRTRQRRGALEHFFRAVPRSFIGHQDWRRVPSTLMNGVSSAAFQSFIDRAFAALEAGTIDADDDTTLNWMPMTVDGQGRQELAEILDEAKRRATAVHSASVARLKSSKGEGVPFIVGLAGFRAAPDSDDTPAGD